jgi:RNA polymerase sigma factor (sigma-70 family)
MKAEAGSTIDGFLEENTDDTFSAAVTVLFPKLVHYFFTRGMDYATAEELTQNVLVSVYKHVKELRSKNLFWAWLFKIAHNEMLQHLRRQRRSLAFVELEGLNEQSIARAGSWPELPASAEFYSWVDSLPSEERNIILLRYVQQLSYDDIAAQLRLPLGTVKWRIFSARRRLATLRREGANRKL